jgi:hypothetical protein
LVADPAGLLGCGGAGEKQLVPCEPGGATRTQRFSLLRRVSSIKVKFNFSVKKVIASS